MNLTQNFRRIFSNLLQLCCFLFLFVMLFLYANHIMPENLAVYVVGIAAAVIHLLSQAPLHRIFRVHTRILEDHREFTGFISTIFASFYGVFLAFTVVSSEGEFSSVKENMDKEVTSSLTLMHSAEQLSYPFALKVTQVLVSYMESVIHDEWKYMAEKKESPISKAKMQEIWDLFGKFEPHTPREIAQYEQSLRALDSFNNARLKRIYWWNEAIGVMSWGVLIVGGVYISIFLFFFGTRHSVIRGAFHSMVISFIAMALYLVYTNNILFNQSVQFAPKPYAKALEEKLFEVPKPGSG